MSENLTQPPDLNITTQSSIDLEITTTDKPGVDQSVLIRTTALALLAFICILTFVISCNRCMKKGCAASPEEREKERCRHKQLSMHPSARDDCEFKEKYTPKCETISAVSTESIH